MNRVESHPLPIGQKIGVYEIKRLSDVGPTAIFYDVKNAHMNDIEVLAEYFPGNLVRRGNDGKTIEILAQSQRTLYDGGLKRFLEKGERLSEIQHPNIERVYNTLQFNGTGYLVLSKVSGTPLINLLQTSTSFGQTELEYLLTALLGGLRHTHENGIVHGDIHPANILIISDGEPLLINFVTNRTAVPDHESPENDAHLNYIAPELFEYGYSLRPTADIYALGATFYRCITLAEPPSSTERLSIIAKGDGDPVKATLESLKENYSEKLMNAVLGMLDPSENKRLQTADAVLSALGASSEASVISGFSDERQASQQTDTSASRSHNMVWLGAAAVILLIAFGLWPSGKDDRQPSKERKDFEPRVSEAIPGVESSQPPIAELPKNAPEVLTTKVEDAHVPSTSIGSPSETVAILTTETNIPAEEPAPVPEQSTEVGLNPQTQTETITEDTSISKPHYPPTNENVDKPAAINDHLAAGEAAFAEFHLSTPANNNAYLHYRTVLNMDPQNTAAAAGIQRIIERYVWLIDRAIKAKNYRHAKAYLSRAKAITPNDARLEKIRKQINTTPQARSNVNGNEEDGVIER